MALRTDYTNTLDSTDTHPTAHNDTNTTVNALEARVTAVETTAAARNLVGTPGYWVWAWEPGSVTTAAWIATNARLVRMLARQAFDQVAVEVTAGVTGSMQVGIYSVTAQGLPSTLAAQGSVDVSANGIKTISFTALPAGQYWLAFHSNQAPTMRTASQGNPLYLTATTQSVLSISALSAWQLTGLGALPSPFVGTPGNSGTGTPVAQLRLA